jgi:hypothetical protein
VSAVRLVQPEDERAAQCIREVVVLAALERLNDDIRGATGDRWPHDGLEVYLEPLRNEAKCDRIDAQNHSVWKRARKWVLTAEGRVEDVAGDGHVGLGEAFHPE